MINEWTPQQCIDNIEKRSHPDGSIEIRSGYDGAVVMHASVLARIVELLKLVPPSPIIPGDGVHSKSGTYGVVISRSESGSGAVWWLPEDHTPEASVHVNLDSLERCERIGRIDRQAAAFGIELPAKRPAQHTTG